MGVCHRMFVSLSSSLWWSGVLRHWPPSNPALRLHCSLPPIVHSMVHCQAAPLIHMQPWALYLLWPPYVADADIIFCSCGFSFFSLAYSQPSQIGCLPYFNTWCGLSANVECRSEMCCTWLAENAGRKNYAKKLPSVHHHTSLSGCIFITKACIDNRKKTC